MEKSDPVQRVLEKAVNCGERKAVGKKAGVLVRLEKKEYPKRHGGTGWKVEAKNHNGSIRELESGLSAGEADRMFERLRDQYNLDEESKDD